MLLAALLQAAAPAAAPPAPVTPAPVEAAAPKLRPSDAATAVDTFKLSCWAHFREPDDLRAAIPTLSLPLAEQPKARSGPTTVWRTDEAVLTYVAGDDLPAGVPSRQCTLRTKLAGAADQLTLAARVAQALSLAGGRTRTGRGAAQTIWDVRQPDGRTARLIATTTNASGGQTDLRLQALLLAQR
ncbi:hypothetical protein SAMN05192580_2788 [Sphingomonas jatrophae]|uniref:Uncharacterized protein n=2 Tax=Sphingomonas jatrophae TaxID=1166337 RepID=A0A1I6LIS7_9SPHN|nr:hypothetical protein SAMN05192580_2788 [Sphingomonas jatrophae]